MATRRGVPWTDEEHETLLKRVAKRVDWEDIAIKHKRTVWGVRARVLMHIFKLVQNNAITLEEATKKYNLPLEDIQSFIEAKQQCATHSKRNKSDDNTIVTLLCEVRDLLKELVKTQQSSPQINTPVTVACENVMDLLVFDS